MQRCDSLLEPHAAGRVEHGIGRREVIAAALGDDEDEKRNEVHPTDGAEALGSRREEAEAQTCNPQWKSEERELELVRKKSAGSADANVAGVDVSKKIQRDEMMLRLPDKIWQKDEQGKSNAEDKPPASQIGARAGDEEGEENSEGKERHGIFRHHAEAYREADPQPPTRILLTEQAHNKVGREHPAEIVEGDVLHERSADEAERKRSSCRNELSVAASAKVARHEAGENHGNCFRDGGEETKARQRCSEQYEREPAEEWSDGRIRDVAPGEVPRIFKSGQFIAMKSIPRAGDEMDDDGCECDADEQRRIDDKGLRGAICGSRDVSILPSHVDVSPAKLY